MRKRNTEEQKGKKGERVRKGRNEKKDKERKEEKENGGFPSALTVEARLSEY